MLKTNLCRTDTSRPTFRALEVSDDDIKHLQSLLFNDNGTLRKAYQDGVDLGQGYKVLLQNPLSSVQQTDVRYQLVLKKKDNWFYKTIEKSLKGVLGSVFDNDEETIESIAVLFGGTKEQPLHHDIARQSVVFKDEAEGVQEIGWEHDQELYNTFMSSPHAPSSVIIGLTQPKVNVVNLGIQNDQVEFPPEHPGHCMIIGGVVGEMFKIVERKEHLVHIRVPGGCMFTGDFRHAGVAQTSQSAISSFKKIQTKVENAIKSKGENRDKVTNAVMTVLCANPVAVCASLHCLILPKTNSLILTDHVGFSGCALNE